MKRFSVACHLKVTLNDSLKYHNSGNKQLNFTQLSRIHLLEPVCAINITSYNCHRREMARGGYNAAINCKQCVN